VRHHDWWGFDQPSEAKFGIGNDAKTKN